MKKNLFLIALVLVAQVCFSQTLRIAVYQYADNPRIKNLEPFANHLQHQTGITTTVKSYPTVHDLIDGMKNGEVDLAFISTFGYLLLQAGESKHSMSPIAALVAPNAKDNYKTAVVSRRNDSLLNLQDLKRYAALYRIAFVAKGSTSGNLVPRLLLNGAGIKDADTDFKSVEYAGTHAKAIELLLSDSVDVAAMGSTEWDKLDSVKKARLRLLHFSSEIPLGPVLLNRTINDELKKQIIQSLLDLHQTNTLALEAIKAAWSEAKQATHFISISENYYAPYLKQFGKYSETETIIKAFIN